MRFLRWQQRLRLSMKRSAQDQGAASAVAALTPSSWLPDTAMTERRGGRKLAGGACRSRDRGWRLLPWQVGVRGWVRAPSAASHGTPPFTDTWRKTDEKLVRKQHSMSVNMFYITVSKLTPSSLFVIVCAAFCDQFPKIKLCRNKDQLIANMWGMLPYFPIILTVFMKILLTGQSDRK